MLQLTSRDDAMLDWMNVVRLADVEAVRWALAGFQNYHGDGPVSVRRANHWIARMAELGYIDRTRPMYRDRQIVWPTYLASGRSAPRLFRQTMRHEIAVALVSGRYIAAGYAWARDSQPQSLQDHQADGVATRDSIVDLVEVELTPKKVARYRHILSRHGHRMESGGVSKVVYLCTPDAAATVSREADKFVFRDVRDRLVVASAFDLQGRWLDATGSAEVR